MNLEEFSQSYNKPVLILRGDEFRLLNLGRELMIPNSPRREFFAGYDALDQENFPSTIFEENGNMKQRIIKMVDQKNGDIVDYKIKNIQENNRRYELYKSILEAQK